MKKRKDGRLVTRVTLPDGASKDIYGRTKDEVDAKKKELDKQVDAGLVIGDETTVGEWAQIWFKEYKGLKRDHTKAAYQNAYNVHIAPFIGSMRLRDVRQINIRSVMNKADTWQIKNKKGEIVKEGLSSESLQEKVLRTMRQIFKTAVDNNLIITSPCKDIEITKRQKPDKLKALSEDQQAEILNIVKGTRAELFIAVGLYCGLRREETLGLTWSDINFTDMTLAIYRAVTFKNNRPIVSELLKSSAAHRTIPIPEPLVNILEQYNPNHSGTTTLILHHKDKDDETVLISNLVADTKGRTMSETAYRKMWEIASEGVSFEVTSHMLRHTYCTMLHKAGVDLRMAQYLMGHSDIRMTTQIYTHIEKKQIETAAQKLQSVFTSQSKVSQKENASGTSPAK